MAKMTSAAASFGANSIGSPYASTAPFTTFLARDRLPPVPAGFRVKCKQRIELPGQGRRGDRAGKDAETIAAARRDFCSLRR